MNNDFQLRQQAFRRLSAELLQQVIEKNETTFFNTVNNIDFWLLQSEEAQAYAQERATNPYVTAPWLVLLGILVSAAQNLKGYPVGRRLHSIRRTLRRFADRHGYTYGAELQAPADRLAGIVVPAALTNQNPVVL